MPTERIRRVSNVPNVDLSLAGFQLIIIGRFWVIAEENLKRV
jgi:hypothetical protein